MWIMARMPPLGDSDVVNCEFLRRFCVVCVSIEDLVFRECIVYIGGIFVT
jgi:hypothetical protein